MTPTTSAQRWFDEGINEAGKFHSAFRKARGHVAYAGFNFMRARAACKEGEWLIMLEMYREKIKPRTVQFYIQLAEASLEWTRHEHPKLTGAKLEEEACKVMMDSPKPLIALLRDLREMRPFGEYDAIKYALRKRIGGAQMELNFGKVFSAFEALEHEFVLTELPEGKSEAEALRELKEKCDRVSAKLSAQLEGKVTDI